MVTLLKQEEEEERGGCGGGEEFEEKRSTRRITMTMSTAATMQTEEQHQEQEQQQQQQQQQEQQCQEKKCLFEGERENSVATSGGKLNEMDPTTTTTVANSTTMATHVNSCAGCHEHIRDKFIFAVIGLYWHQDCVQCSVCSVKLSDRCYTFDGKLYCRLDYWRRFGPKCFACSETIDRSELVQRIKENRVYHLKCFTCNDCHKQLKAGEQLHLIDGKKLLCKRDYHHHQTTTTACSKLPSSPSSAGVQKQGKSKTSSSLTSKSSSSSLVINDQQQTYYTLTSSNHRESKLAGTAKKADTERLCGRATATSADIKLEDDGQDELEEDEEDEEDEEEDGVGEEDEEEELDDEMDDGVANNALDVDEDNEDFIDDDRIDRNGVGRIHSGISSNGEDLAGLLGFNNNDNNNLENEENHSIMFTSDSIGASANSGNQSLGNKHIKNNSKSIRQQQQRQQLNGGAKKKRRRRQRQLGAGGEASGGTSVRSARGNPAAGLPAKKLTNRNGESILNGMGVAGSQAPSSILNLHSNVHTSVVGSNNLNAAQHQHQHQQQQQQLFHQQVSQQQQQNHHANNKSVSSSASTASNSSTSSSMSHLSLSHQHQNRTTASNHNAHHHQHNPHHHGQQQSAGNTGSAGNTNTSGGGHKPTRVRTVLNEKQLQTLRDCYACNPRPDALMKEQLVDMTGLSSRVIRVWFQDGRHLASLSMMRGVAMVASSPIQYDDHSTVSSTPGGQQQSQSAQGGQPMQLELQARENVTSPSLLAGVDPHSHSHPHQQHHQQQQRQQHYVQPCSVHSPGAQPVDIHAYQPPWKNLIDYAHQQQPGATPPDRLNAASPHYQQLMSQIHGYGNANNTNGDGANVVVVGEQQTGSGNVLELQQATQQQPQQQQQSQFSTNQTTTTTPQNNSNNSYQSRTNNLIDHHAHHTHHHLALAQTSNQQPMQATLSHPHQFQR